MRVKQLAVVAATATSLTESGQKRKFATTSQFVQQGLCWSISKRLTFRRDCEDAEVS